MKASTHSILHLPMIERIKARLDRGRDRVALAHRAGIKASRASASLIDANALTSTRVRAADSLLDHSAKAIESKISKRARPHGRRPSPGTRKPVAGENG